MNRRFGRDRRKKTKEQETFHMKKFVSILAAAICCMAVLAGCGSKGGESSSAPAGAEMKDGQTVQTVVDQIATEIGVAMPSDVDENFLRDMCYIPTEDMTEYAGKIAIVNTSADNVIAVKAAEGKLESVKAGLEKRLEDVQKSFEMYLPEQYEKAKKGQVITKGDYAFLLILGESAESADEDLKKATGIIDAAFA